MSKLVVQILIGQGVWFGLGSLEVHWGYRIFAILGARAFVHQVWIRLFPDPFLCLGAMPIAADDPLMVAAMERGRATLPKFLEIDPEHREDAMVRFRFEHERFQDTDW